MAVNLPLSYETVIQLVEQLPREQQETLLLHLLSTSQSRTLSPDEKKALFHASILSVPVNEAPSIRREDWYDDDGR